MRLLQLALLILLQGGTPAPDVTAANASWQIDNEMIVVSGLSYSPTRETRMFDSQVMMQIDVYEGVPVYADVTREPFTLVYVPLSRSNMRTYERTPTGDAPVISGRGRSTPGAVATAGTIEPSRIEPGPVAPPHRGPALESVPPPRANLGVWIPFNGKSWYSDGPAVSYLRDRFVRVGTYGGFPVYREINGPADRIWIPSVSGGPLAPYARR